MGNVTVSMSRTGKCYDNAVQTRAQARLTIFEFVEGFYNRVRQHSSLGYLSLVVYEQLMC